MLFKVILFCCLFFIIFCTLYPIIRYFYNYLLLERKEEQREEREEGEGEERREEEERKIPLKIFLTSFKINKNNEINKEINEEEIVKRNTKRNSELFYDYNQESSISTYITSIQSYNSHSNSLNYSNSNNNHYNNKNNNTYNHNNNHNNHHNNLLTNSYHEIESHLKDDLSFSYLKNKLNLELIEKINKKNRKVKWSNDLCTDIHIISDDYYFEVDNHDDIDSKVKLNSFKLNHLSLLDYKPKGILKNSSSITNLSFLSSSSPSPPRNSLRTSHFESLHLTLDSNEHKSLQEDPPSYMYNPLVPSKINHIKNLSSLETKNSNKNWKNKQNYYDVYKKPNLTSTVVLPTKNRVPYKKKLSFENDSYERIDDYDEEYKVNPPTKSIPRRHTDIPQTTQSTQNKQFNSSLTLVSKQSQQQKSQQKYDKSRRHTTLSSHFYNQLQHSRHPRYTPEGVRIIELEELETAHHPVWVEFHGVEGFQDIV